MECAFIQLKDGKKKRTSLNVHSGKYKLLVLL